MTQDASPSASGMAPPLGRVMMIDDESFDLKLYGRIISRSGFVTDVVTFTAAEEALAYLLDPQTPPIDLIFLDINMPRMTGFEFMEAACSALGADFDVPVVMMLTTSLNERDRDRACSFHPIKAFFNKPLTQEQLATAARIVAEAA